MIFVVVLAAVIAICISIWTIKKIKNCEQYCQNMMNETQKECDEKKKQCDEVIADTQKKYDSIFELRKKELNELDKLITDTDNDITYSISQFEIDETITSEEYKNKYSILQLDERELIASGNGISIIDTALNKKKQNYYIKQLLRCFNAETALIMGNITIKNIENSRNRVIKSFEALNKLFKLNGIALTKEFLELKLKMINVKYAQEFQKEQERLQQKAIREQMVEEEKVRREIEKAKSKIEKEENHFKNEIDKMMVHLKSASDVEKQLYVDKIKELEEKLKQVEENKRDVLNREKSTRAGYVYIISNIGSFGENIYKIGMTRRLDPMDRIDELSSASVPFAFDVHAMIFSEDAPQLETALHNAFDDKRVNMVNSRKEFFHVSLEEIEKVVKEKYNATVNFTMTAKAEQYRQTLEIINKKMEVIN